MQAAQTPISLQQDFWNDWNASHREHAVDIVSLDQAGTIQAWLEGIGRTDLDIIEVGCGSGWLCSQLTAFGRVTGTDLSDRVLARAAERVPQARFVAGDFMALDFGRATQDVAISLEVLSHVADQPAFLRKIASLLKPGGYLMLATQNRPALERNTIAPPRPGQLRRWVDRHELGALLQADFVVEALFSVTPQFNCGALRIVNSPRVKRLAASAGLSGVTDIVKKLQEHAWLGWTLMALARKRG
jgi:2-polyprenyl-3-methyl-5-hydroxy-6-metoxy-1,4-benzoquinol methylase